MKCEPTKHISQDEVPGDYLNRFNIAIALTCSAISSVINPMGDKGFLKLHIPHYLLYESERDIRLQKRWKTFVVCIPMQWKLVRAKCGLIKSQKIVIITNPKSLAPEDVLFWIAHKFNVSLFTIYGDTKRIGKRETREFGFHISLRLKAEHNVLQSAAVF